MSIRPTATGGRIAFEDTPFGRYRVEFDVEGRVISGWCDIRDPRRSQGLGDTIAKGTKLIGIPRCNGCEKRRKILNRFVPYEAKD